jgi:hypothetical protein
MAGLVHRGYEICMSFKNKWLSTQRQGGISLSQLVTPDARERLRQYVYARLYGSQGQDQIVPILEGASSLIICYR